MLEELLQLRRDTRHFTADPVPQEVLDKALQAGHMAPTVGLTDATHYYVVRSAEVKAAIKLLFSTANDQAAQLIQDEQQKELYRVLKLEAITDAPLGLVICYDRSVLNDFTIGTVASNETLKFSAVCAVQNIWLSLTEQGYSLGWVSILNYYRFKQVLGLNEDMEPLGYFCIGKPATDYNHQPMLQQLGWKTRAPGPKVQEIAQPHIADRAEDQDVTVDSVRKDNKAFALLLQKAIDGKTKPLGALGRLEELALQAGELFQSLTPELIQPHLLVFAADHGIAQHGVSAYPQEVTRQMVNNFLDGGAAINVFCRQHHISLKIVDAGVNYDFAPRQQIRNQKIGRGTRSFLNQAAMSALELELCMSKGAALVSEVRETGCNVIGFGEMGIGNTSSAAVLMSLLTRLPLEDCIGAGTGLDKQQLDQKRAILLRAADNYTGDGSDLNLMAWFGGFEIMQIAGGLLEACKHRMLILVDGFISTVAYLCAFKLNPEIKRNAVFCHQSDEKGHRLLLEYLDAKPVLQLQLRLGEGTGCALAYPLLVSAISFLAEMASFDSAAVSKTRTSG